MTRHLQLSLLALVGALVLTSSALGASKPLVVKIGTNRLYTQSQLHPGTKVVCHYRGKTLSVTAPTGQYTGSGAVWPKPGTTNAGIFHLNVDTAAGHQYSVRCGLGGYHWGGPYRP